MLQLPSAPNPAAVLAPYVNDDTFAAAYVDVGSVKVADLLQVMPQVSGVPQSWMLGAMMLDGVVRRYQEAGGAGVYVVVGLGDIRVGGGPVGIATARPGKSAEDVERLIRELIKELQPAAQLATGGGGVQIDVLRKGDAVLIGTKLSVARYAALKSSPRGDLVEPLAALVREKALAAGVFCPGPDYRRVSRELWPKLPGGLRAVEGRDGRPLVVLRGGGEPAARCAAAHRARGQRRRSGRDLRQTLARHSDRSDPVRRQ